MSDNKKESISRTLLVAFLVCLVCSLVVAGAALGLKPAQLVNSQLNKQRSILSIAAEAPESASAAEVQRLFKERIQARIVDLDEGRFSDAQDPATYDATKALQDANLSRDLTAEEDVASIHRRERYATVYTVEEDGQLKTIILPVRGYGLWSTLYGFVALKNDLKTVTGLGFYQQAETAGLGGEVDNPRWKELWKGKLAFNDAGEPDIHVIKGNVDASSPNAAHQVDGLAGATLTSKGVQHLLDFWLGQNGFGPFLANLRQNGVQALPAAQAAPAPQLEAIPESEPDATPEPETVPQAQPEAMQTQPETQPATQPEEAQPAPQPEEVQPAAQPEEAQPTPQPEAVQPEAHPEVLQPEVQDAEPQPSVQPVPQPEAQPQVQQPNAQSGEQLEVRPEVLQPEAAQPAAQPEAVPSGEQLEVRPDLLQPDVEKQPQAQQESEEI